MNDNDYPEPTESSDSFTEDAASWNASGSHAVPPWGTPAAGHMTSIYLPLINAGTPDLSTVEISAAKPFHDIARLVRDPSVNQIQHLRTVQFWIGDNSLAAQPVNLSATRFLYQMLMDVRDGRYIASDRERGHAGSLLATPDDLPVIHGPCLVTGIGANHGPGELDENFQSWLTTLHDEITRTRALIAAIATATGLAPDQIDLIVIPQ